MLPAPDDRDALRRQLLAERERFVSRAGTAAQEQLEVHLREVLAQVEPQTLGLYWPVRHEFNAVGSLVAFARSLEAAVALPFCTRGPREADDGTPGMHYRGWDGGEPRVRDACGLPSADGRAVVPDVVLVPCLGFTGDGFRLGYGAGFFDRWLGVHPHVTAVGVAWSVARLGAGRFVPQPHDQPLTFVVTEDGVA
ncbi:MAG: 5-formyltetrahydrofolate cyclo-ligase [Ideonella sp.]|jgi:5,10-methenyltetrahydrofolate synthetase|nr:5-formyltetrahydrofolate cyclo-ligase [Ideonella sp.]